MTKKIKPRKSNSSWAIKILIFSLVLLFLGVLSIAAYKKGYTDGEKIASLKYEKDQEKLLAKVTKITSPSQVKVKGSDLSARNDLVGKLQDVLKAEQEKPPIDTKHEFDSNTLGHPPQGPIRVVKKKPIYSKFKKAKLAIIMDDVSFSRDVDAIKRLNFPITMSFLPPSAGHPNSAKLAAKEKCYMVHLPLEAMHFSSEEAITLHVNDSKSLISEHIKEIKSLFPRVYYINNHTGSRFTSDKNAVSNLISVLEREGIGFLDSRTTAKTKVPEVMASFGKPYVARDLFLDHEADVTYIEGQIIKAIAQAKKHGSAIAIGHPRKETLQALKNSKRVLKSVELVYVNKVI